MSESDDVKRHAMREIESFTVVRRLIFVLGLAPETSTLELEAAVVAGREVMRERDALKAAMRPIPVSERLPDMYQRVLIFWGGEWREGFYNHHCSYWCDTLGEIEGVVTHWTPFPSTPAP